MPVIARVKYPPNREARASVDHIGHPQYVRIDDWVEVDGEWKRTKVGAFVRKQETAEAFAALLTEVAGKLSRAERAGAFPPPLVQKGRSKAE